MNGRQRVYRKSRLFRNEGILIHVPKTIQVNGVDKELFIGQKKFEPFNFAPQHKNNVDDPVINFFVYYVDNGKIIYVTNFPEHHLVLQVGYEVIHAMRELIIYDDTGGNDQRFTLGQGTLQDVPGGFYGYPGSVIVELDKIPPDPNVGWGG